MTAFVALYLALMLAIVLYGGHRYWLAWGARRAVPQETRSLEAVFPKAPTVLVQLPIYNERDVVPRLLAGARGLVYPHDRLTIQVLDDSDDGSEAEVAAGIAELQAEGVPIEHIRRDSRAGYKAGALKAGLARCDAEFVALFDADFIIPSDFLQRMLPSFSDPRVGMAQARWRFMNEPTNLLTRIQAVMLDGHFAVEHAARAAAGRFFNFNGTAGVWRRAAIDDAGGWRADTITEDLDLSIRAWLRGWRFRYLPDVHVDSVLPEEIPAFKIQQNRWVSGSLQTAKKCLAPIWGSRLSLRQKVDLTFYLTGNCTYLFLFVLALAVPLAVLMRLDTSRSMLLLWTDLPFFLLATLSVFVFYGRARGERGRVSFYLARVPALMALGLGMSLHNSRAVLRGFLGKSRVFERTPKGVVQRQVRRRRSDPIVWLEPAMAIYLCAPLLMGMSRGSWLSLPFMSLFTLGFLFVFLQARRWGKGNAG